MRVLIYAGNGMIGHRLWLRFRDTHDTWVTLRQPVDGKPWGALYKGERVLLDVRAEEPHSLERPLELARPDVVINALGLIKQRPEVSSEGAAFRANCFVPQFLRRQCDERNARLIQISTDCVFSGRRGKYTEQDQPDSLDTYGLSKRLGEVGPPHLTLRTSAVGRSLSGSDGLLEWFLSQRGTIPGYRSALFSGLITDELAAVVARIVEQHPDMTGVWHVAAPPIDKYDLLMRLRDAYHHDVEISPVDEPVIDRTLDDSHFRAVTGMERPTWDEMIHRLAADSTPYAALRGEH